jgi:hypothetical protein
MAYTFGVTTTVGSVTGLLQNVTITGSSQIAEAIGATGAVVENKGYGSKSEFTAELVYESGLPSNGADITVGGTEFIVTSVGQTEVNTEYKKCTISGTQKFSTTT